jgi:tetratricopeptide (TPR) repeat protein
MRVESFAIYMLQLKSQAIQTAMIGDWEKAISLNKLILEEDPEDIDTLNRLAFAFLSQGSNKNAKTLYQKVLLLDMKNPIALRNLKRLTDDSTKKTSFQLGNFFIEEPGKTKIIELINVADKKIISHLRSGEKLTLSIKRMKIFAIDQNNQYIGMLPDDLCKRLIKFIHAGNKYEAYTRTAESTKISIFIRELKRVKRYKDQPSFVYTEKAKLSLDNNSNSMKSHNEDKDVKTKKNQSPAEEPETSD